jgi:hypothetical protein
MSEHCATLLVDKTKGILTASTSSVFEVIFLSNLDSIQFSIQLFEFSSIQENLGA